MKRTFGWLIVLGLVAGVWSQPLSALIEAARKDQKLVSYGVPADWGGYGQIAEIMGQRYGLPQTDTDTAGGETLAKLAAERNNPVADVADMGLQFAHLAADRDLLLPYKHSRWEEVPDWARDPNGRFSAAYLGTVVFAINPRVVKNLPKSWKDLLKPEYKGLVSLQDPRRSGIAQMAVIAAAFANGGSETRIDPGISYFAQLQKTGNLKPVSPNQDLLARGEIGIAITLDLRATQWKKAVPQLVLQVPQDASVFTPYAPVINKFTRRPNAAKLWVETVFSDEGQIAFARAGARPIRKVKLPTAEAELLIPEAQYASVRAITRWERMDEIAQQVGQRWASEVLDQ